MSEKMPGGWGYAHIVDVLLPRFVAAGVEVDIDEEIRIVFGVEPEDLKQVSRERVREILSKCSGSLAADIIADREDRL